MKQVKKIVDNMNKPVNSRVVKLLSLAGILVIFFPQWFGAIPFPVSDVIKGTVEWVCKGIDLTLICWALFTPYEYKGSIYKRDQI